IGAYRPCSGKLWIGQSSLPCCPLRRNQRLVFGKIVDYGIDRIRRIRVHGLWCDFRDAVWAGVFDSGRSGKRALPRSRGMELILGAREHCDMKRRQFLVVVARPPLHQYAADRMTGLTGPSVSVGDIVELI